MRRQLIPHAQTPPRARLTVETYVRRLSVSRLLVVYGVGGDIARLKTPAPAAPERTDELWRTTCFEAFVRRGDSAAYLEFNFSPSGRWAVYGFTGYREGMEPLTVSEPPSIKMRREGPILTCEAEFEIGDAGEDAVSLGLSTVIEETDGTKSYWALAHAPGKPDFHHADAFVLQLPPWEAS